ncbi:MAG: hypothetical protein AB7Y74_05740, partial [Syntrophorhabdus sp.]
MRPSATMMNGEGASIAISWILQWRYTLFSWIFVAKLKDRDYKYAINTCTQYKADEPHLHWYLQIRPRFTTIAGFEIGSGIRINPSNPEI